jgi:hypothetical protein
MISERFNPSNGFLETNWEGDIGLEEIIEYIRRTKLNTQYPRRLKILTTAEKAVFNLTIDDLVKISMENELSVGRYDLIIDAFVVDKAVESALTTMYKSVSAAKNYYFQVFSSREAAKNWLDLI